MPVPTTPEVLHAWNALWDAKSPFYLPNTLQKKTRVGFSWFRPLTVNVSNTGQIVVLNSTAFGIVTVELRNAVVSDLWKVKGGTLSFDPASGKLSVELIFSALKFAGDYEVRRGRATGDALKMATRTFSGHPIFQSSAMDTDSDLTLARTYQPRLSQTANGQQMLNTYYTHNEAFSTAFQNQSFGYHWANDDMYGNTTKGFADLTATAAQPGNTSTVIVNSTDGKTYNDNYRQHSYHMQNILVVACNSQGNNDAATAASNFKIATVDHSGTAQTVDTVFNIVSTDTPPSVSAIANFVEPDWLAAINERNKPIHEAIEREEEAVRRGVIIREETTRPIHSGFVSYVPAPSLKLTGTLTQPEDGTPTVHFDVVDGIVQNVDLALGVFPGKLHPELSAAVAKANFLKSVLSRQITNSLAASSLLPHVGRLLSLALMEGTPPIR
jgi:hypothetical protein